MKWWRKLCGCGLQSHAREVPRETGAQEAGTGAEGPPSPSSADAVNSVPSGAFFRTELPWSSAGRREACAEVFLHHNAVRLDAIRYDDHHDDFQMYLEFLDISDNFLK